MNDLIEYMQAALEGKAGLPPFTRWFADNEESLQAQFDRGTYLRLKHSPLPEFRKILDAHGVKYEQDAVASLPRGPQDCSWVQAEWLSRRVFPYEQSPSQLANANVAKLDELLHMIELKETGDELWHFSSPSESWHNMMGRGGIALVRGGKVIYAIVLRMN